LAVIRIFAILFLSLAVFGAPADPPADSTSVLAHILAQKGVISSQELARVESAAEPDRVKTLATILRDKGVLNQSDLAKLSLPATQNAPVLAGPSSSKTASNAAPTTVVASSANAPSAPQAAVPHPPVETNTAKKIPVTFYGTLLFNAGFDTTGMNLEDDSTVVTKPGSSPTAQDQSFWGTARQTRIGLRLNPTQVAGARLTGDFEFDAYSADAPFTNGYNMPLFRLRLAYGRLDWKNVALEIGQDWAIFAPLNPTSLSMFAVPEFSAAGNPWGRVPQVRFEAKTTLNSTNRLLFQVSANEPNIGDFPQTFIGTEAPGVGELGRMPALEGRVAWTIGSGDRDYSFGFSGHYGRGKNVGTVGDTTVVQSVDSWGAAVDWVVPFTHFLNLTGEAYMGRALGIYNVASGETVGAVGTTGGHGVLSRGGWAQLQLNLHKYWQFNGGYGIDNPDASNLPVGSRNRNQNYFGNIIFSLNPNIQFSLEYRRLITAFRNQPFFTGRGNQLTLSAAYSF
jgi:hypothetical protein